MRNLPLTFDCMYCTVKSKGKISKNFVAFSEYMNFSILTQKLFLGLPWRDIDEKHLIERVIQKNFNPIVLTKLADHFFRNCIIVSVFCPKEMNGS